MFNKNLFNQVNFLVNSISLGQFFYFPIVILDLNKIEYL